MLFDGQTLKEYNRINIFCPECSLAASLAIEQIQDFDKRTSFWTSEQVKTGIAQIFTIF